jgi:hypothetical protein
MLMALILLTWMWDRVVANCDGGQEAIAYYQFQATLRVTQMGTCPTLQGNKTYACKVVVPLAPQVFGPRVSDPPSGSTVQTVFDPIEYPAALPMPPVGGLSAWPWPSPENPSPVVAVDHGGNASGEGTCR